MKAFRKLRDLMEEVIELLARFFKPIGIQDTMLDVPKSVKKLGTKVGVLNLIMTVIALVFAFLLKLANLMIEARLILLGMILFMLYRGQQVVKEAFRLFQDSEANRYELIFEDEIIYHASGIIGKVSNRVLKYYKDEGIYRVMTNESVLNTMKNYLQSHWKQEVQRKFDMFEMASVVIMIIASFITNTTIPQTIFVPLILVFTVLSFFSSAYIGLNRKEFYRKNREFNNEQSLIANDLLRVPVIVEEDLDMRVKRFKKTVIASNENFAKFHKKMNTSF